MGVELALDKAIFITTYWISEKYQENEGLNLGCTSISEYMYEKWKNVFPWIVAYKFALIFGHYGSNVWNSIKVFLRKNKKNL